MPGMRCGHLWMVLTCIVLSALWIDFGEIHRCHTADSIVMALVSLYHWTPLYWEQDRLGMLFPLAATPWRHPLDNLLAQGAMTSVAALASMFLLGWYTVGRRRGTAIGALAGLFLVGFCRLDQQFEYLIMLQQNAPALALGVGGLLMLGRWGRQPSAVWPMLGVTALAAAHWINPAMAFVLGPLVIVRGLCFRELPAYFSAWDEARETSRVEPLPTAEGIAWPWRVRPARDEALALLAIVASVGGCILLSRLTAQPKAYHFLAFGDWMACLRDMHSGLHVYFHHRWFSAVEITALVGVLTLFWPAGRRAARLSVPVVAGLLLVAAVQFAFMGSLDHVRENHSARYILLSVLIWQAVWVGFAVIQLGAVLPSTRWSRALPLSLAVAMTLLVAVRHGTPSVERVRAALDESLGRYTDDLLAADCTHVTGDYWHAWPAMFHVNLRLADQRSSRTVWAIAPRSSATAEKWRRVPWTEARIGAIAGDEPQAARFLGQYQVPPVWMSGRVGTIRVLRPASDWHEQPVPSERQLVRK